MALHNGQSSKGNPKGSLSSAELGQSSRKAGQPHKAAYNKNALRRPGPGSSSKLQNSSIIYHALYRHEEGKVALYTILVAEGESLYFTHKRSSCQHGLESQIALTFAPSYTHAQSRKLTAH
eukprot:1112101-Pelagomonas_calceolata.AAC.1